MIPILIIHQSAELYGSDRTLLMLLQNINREQFLPVVVLPSQGPLVTELEKINIKVVIAPVLKLYRKMFTVKNIYKFIADAKKAFVILDELNKEYNFKIVYSNTLAVLLGGIYAKRRKIKHLWHVHEIIVHPKPIATLYPYLINRYSTKVICNSFATKQNIVERLPKLDNKCVVIHNGIEVKNDVIDTNVSLKKELGFQENDIIITLVGRISRLKGHKWLLKTYLEKVSSNNIKLLFVGSPVEGQEYYLEEVEEIITTNNLKNKVKILPFTKQLNKIWSITDVAVMPSTEAESFGLVALEAMLAKKAVIGSNHGGLKEIVINKETGILVAPNDVDALAKAIKELINNSELRTLYGNAGHERAINKFSLKNYINSLEALFISAL